MAGTTSEDLAVKRTAVRLLSSACDGVLDEDAPLAAALLAAMHSPNDPLFMYNYRVAEAEFRRLPRETSDTLMSRCQSRIAETQDDILAEIKSLKARGPRMAAPPKKPASKKVVKKTTAVEWT